MYDVIMIVYPVMMIIYHVSMIVYHVMMISNNVMMIAHNVMIIAHNVIVYHALLILHNVTMRVCTSWCYDDVLSLMVIFIIRHEYGTRNISVGEKLVMIHILSSYRQKLNEHELFLSLPLFSLFNELILFCEN